MIYCPTCKKYVNESMGIGYDFEFMDRHNGKLIKKICKVRQIHCEVCNRFIVEDKEVVIPYDKR